MFASFKISKRKISIVLLLFLALASLLLIFFSNILSQTSSFFQDSQLSKNLGDAHVRTNGQLLLLLLLSSLFIFTSHSRKLKKIIIGLGLFSILVHTIAMVGSGYFSVFNTVLTISGYSYVLLSLTMALLIYRNFSIKRRSLKSLV